MRKLAPVFVMTSIVALVGGNALATMSDKTTTTSTVTGSPTVSANTKSPQDLSYSDKSNTSPGTNAVMEGKSKDAMLTPKTSTMATMDDEKQMMKAKKKVKKAKVAANSDTTLPGSMPTAAPVGKTSTKATSGAAANSTTGTSPGSDGGSSAGAGSAGSSGSSGSSGG